MSEISHPGPSLNEAARMPLRTLYLHCGHCRSWSPSRTVFWYFEGFQRARSRGAINCCSICFKASSAIEQSYRAYLSDGQLLEG